MTKISSALLMAIMSAIAAPVMHVAVEWCSLTMMSRPASSKAGVMVPSAAVENEISVFFA